MLEKDEGIVLGASRSGETSVLLVFLGRRSGKIRLMAKGALSSKHPARGMLEPGNHLEVLYYHKEGRTLFFMKEAALLTPPIPERDSLPHMVSLLAVVELLDQVCYVGAADSSLVDLAVDYVRCRGSADPLFLFLAFELKLLEALGAAPDLAACSQCGASVAGGAFSPRDAVSYCREHKTADPESLRLSADVVAVAQRCLAQPLQELAQVSVARTERKDLGRIVHWTYTFHVQGYSLPKSLNLI